MRLSSKRDLVRRRGVVDISMRWRPSSGGKIHRIVYNPPGSDTGANWHLNKEKVVLHNTGARRRNIGGWKIRDIAGHRYRIPDGVRLGPDRYVRLHTGNGYTGNGSNDRNDLFWDNGWTSGTTTATARRSRTDGQGQGPLQVRRRRQGRQLLAASRPVGFGVAASAVLLHTFSVGDAAGPSTSATCDRRASSCGGCCGPDARGQPLRLRLTGIGHTGTRGRTPRPSRSWATRSAAPPPRLAGSVSSSAVVTPPVPSKPSRQL